ncbi:unnamed protein product [Phytophthora fragariaefolia]|uniref:Unnamed protein product n=1 Tax=Phytophthora fragariaefolia TaxID=1490495 RepID=A0A9W6Y0P1_9STRA|nr:unnamed protein product [Phytophthora fragariaefolia]
MLEQEDFGMCGKSTLDQRRIERRETREAREMFDIEPDSDSDNGALGEVLSVLDEADREPSSSNNDDSDYEDNAASARSSSDDSGVVDEISQGAGNDAAGNAQSEQDDAAVADDKVGSEILCKLHPNLHRISNRTGSWYLRVNPSGFHNHNLNRHIWGNYAENRTVKDPKLSEEVKVLRKAGANAQGILHLRDVHNMVQRHRNEEQAGLTEAQRAFAVLEEFCRQHGGNSANLLVDCETNVARIATFQTARMKRLFKAFPEVIMVDSTHDTNVNRYKLFIFVVHDVFGKVSMIETKWGKLKDIINDSFTIDQLLSTLITLQNYAEEQYLAEYHRVGSSPSRSCEDRELTLLALQLSPFAFNLIVKEHALATGLNADYNVELGVPGLARLTSPRSGATYEVNTRRERVVFPGLSQVSSVEGARLSQLSLCAVASSPERNIESGTLQNDENTDIEHNSSADKSSSTDMFAANAEEDTHTSGVETVTLPSGSGSNLSEEATKLRPKATKSSKSSKERAKAVSWSFRKRPVINGMTKAQRKRAQAKQDRDAAIEMAAKYRQGEISKFVSFDEVAALLDGPYSLFHSKAMVDALVLPRVDISGPFSVREFKVGQDVPVITKIPPLPNVLEAIDAIKLKQNIDLLAYWPEYGYATFDQLDAMASLAEAQQPFSLVLRTTLWIDKVEWCMGDLRAPFADTSNITKTEHKAYVETLNLGVNRVRQWSPVARLPRESVASHHINSTVIIGSPGSVRGRWHHQPKLPCFCYPRAKTSCCGRVWSQSPEEQACHRNYQHRPPLGVIPCRQNNWRRYDCKMLHVRPASKQTQLCYYREEYADSSWAYSGPERKGDIRKD